jgi:uncharacterized protein (DUF2126 family)/transglutaminase-like putative cysteine protease
MAIRVGLHHVTEYHYDKLISLGPHVVRLRPAPHCRTPILSYSLKVKPEDHFINWQQDPHGNFLARFVFPKQTKILRVEVDVVAEMIVINPFDFFLEEYAQKFPFKYEEGLARELRPYLETLPETPEFNKFMRKVSRESRGTTDSLVTINQLLQSEIKYLIRLEPGVQTPEETLIKRSGSCRDSAWLMVQMLRSLGLAARFVSGYLIQLTADVKSLDGPSGPTADFTDLHAWTEVYLPGAGWVGLDPTSGLLAGEGHIPLAATPDPSSAAPITGALDPCEVRFDFSMKVSRIHEDPRVTKPYTETQWQSIQSLGQAIDDRLQADDVRLTMGGEPTFVSIDDMEGAEWNTSAVGPQKRHLSEILIKRMRARIDPGALLHYGQGKWYPGESLPRWALSCYWRLDGEPIWLNPDLIADVQKNYGYGTLHARRFVKKLANHLGITTACVLPAYEDVAHYLWKEQRLPINVDPRDPKLKEPEERARMVHVFERGVGEPVGFVMPLKRQWWQAKAPSPPPESRHNLAAGRWVSGRWPVRSEKLFLLPGDSPVGLRLPLDSLPVVTNASGQVLAPEFYPTDPSSDLPPLARRPLRQQPIVVGRPVAVHQAGITEQQISPQHRALLKMGEGENADVLARKPLPRHGTPDCKIMDPLSADDEAELEDLDWEVEPTGEIVRTALCVEARAGRLHVFMPPVERLEDYLDLVAAVEWTADELQMPVVVEGYLPPNDPRIQQLRVTPDPGVIEVNVQPAASWSELVANTETLYEEARQSRLGTEKFDLDGKHSGTGGGNHIVLGGRSTSHSPFLRRPDVLKSLIGYWVNHPSLSYLFSGRFIGPTSQAPRVDEGRRDALYELELAFSLVPRPPADGSNAGLPPWLVDRIFRNLLTDLTGNTHRAEFCIDKLYSPDSSTGRLGLVELRGFEMPPHPQMSLTQQLLIRAMVSHFWRKPYEQPLISWGTSLHDRFMLPHFVWQDFGEVLDELQRGGISMDRDWFRTHFEFRFPKIGTVTQRDMQLELRTAIEPWYVLGEEPAGGGTVRFVDSSVERMQVRVTGLFDSRHVVTCNGRRIPLHATGRQGEFVAAVRYRAWCPPNCLHPTVPLHVPLVFDILDSWSSRSIGGCTYHVAHPAGRTYETFPVNALEAEARRVARFFKIGHSPGNRPRPVNELNPDFPLTLDLRRPVSPV